MAEDLGKVETIESAWRPLKPIEKSRAEYYLGVASRKIRRRWADVDARIADPSDKLTADDVEDVIVQMVIPAVDVAPVRGAKSFTIGMGPMSRSATLDRTSADPLVFEQWMIDVFAPVSDGALPRGSFPAAPNDDHMFITPEGRYS